MNLSNKILLAIALLKIVGFSQAMEEAKNQIRACKPVKLPSAPIIKQRLQGLGLDYFVEKTEIDVELGDQEKHPIEVLATVKDALSEFTEYINNRPQANAISMLKPDIMKAILQDSSEAVAAFEKFYSLQAKR